jgi:hypothetical protein
MPTWINLKTAFMIRYPIPGISASFFSGIFVVLMLTVESASLSKKRATRHADFVNFVNHFCATLHHFLCNQLNM